MTALISRPWFIGVITVIVIGWIGLNLGSATLGLRPIDPPPFPWLEGAVSLGSLYMVVMILATQRREDQLAQHREMLILEVTLLSEQKIAKVIQLLENSVGTIRSSAIGSIRRRTLWLSLSIPNQ